MSTCSWRSVKATSNSPAVDGDKKWRKQVGEIGFLAGKGVTKSKIMGRWSEMTVSTISLTETENLTEMIKGRVLAHELEHLQTR